MLAVIVILAIPYGAVAIAHYLFFVGFAHSMPRGRRGFGLHWRAAMSGLVWPYVMIHEWALKRRLRIGKSQDGR